MLRVSSFIFGNKSNNNNQLNNNLNKTNKSSSQETVTRLNLPKPADCERSSPPLDGALTRRVETPHVFKVNLIRNNNYETLQANSNNSSLSSTSSKDNLNESNQFQTFQSQDSIYQLVLKYHTESQFFITQCLKEATSKQSPSSIKPSLDETKLKELQTRVNQITVRIKELVDFGHECMGNENPLVFAFDENAFFNHKLLKIPNFLGLLNHELSRVEQGVKDFAKTFFIKDQKVLNLGKTPLKTQKTSFSNELLEVAVFDKIVVPKNLLCEKLNFSGRGLFSSEKIIQLIEACCNLQVLDLSKCVFTTDEFAKLLSIRLNKLTSLFLSHLNIKVSEDNKIYEKYKNIDPKKLNFTVLTSFSLVTFLSKEEFKHSLKKLDISFCKGMTKDIFRPLVEKEGKLVSLEEVNLASIIDEKVAEGQRLKPSYVQRFLIQNPQLKSVNLSYNKAFEFKHLIGVGGYCGYKKVGSNWKPQKRDENNQSLIEKLDLQRSGVKLQEIKEVEDLVKYFPGLKEINLYDCKVTQQALIALIEKASYLAKLYYKPSQEISFSELQAKAKEKGVELKTTING